MANINIDDVLHKIYRQIYNEMCFTTGYSHYDMYGNITIRMGFNGLSKQIQIFAELL